MDGHCSLVVGTLAGVDVGLDHIFCFGFGIAARRARQQNGHVTRCVIGVVLRETVRCQRLFEWLTPPELILVVVVGGGSGSGCRIWEITIIDIVVGSADGRNYY